MITWDEEKRQRNLKDHGIDFADCESIFDYPMLTEDDKSEPYGEQRLKSYGYFRGRVVVLIWTERATGAHLISCRYAKKPEIRKYHEAFP